MHKSQSWRPLPQWGGLTVPTEAGLSKRPPAAGQHAAVFAAPGRYRVGPERKLFARSGAPQQRGKSVAEKRLTGRIAAEHIKLLEVPRPPQGAVERFQALGD